MRMVCCITVPQVNITFMLSYSSVEGFGLEAEARMTTWHVAVPSENESENVQSQDVSEGCSFYLFMTFLQTKCVVY